MKECRDCGVEKPLDEFSPSKKNADGRVSYCRPCLRTRGSNYRAKTRKRPVSHKPAEVAAGHKWCARCQRAQPLAEFGRNRSSRDGLTTYCRHCHNGATYESRQRRGGSRHYHLRRRYGIGQADYDALVEQQGGLCALCRQRAPEHVDHDHLTGRVRGLLCSCCNQALGNARDDIATLQRAIDYLRRTTYQRVPVAPSVFRIEPPQPEETTTYIAVGLADLISSSRR